MRPVISTIAIAVTGLFLLLSPLAAHASGGDSVRIDSSSFLHDTSDSADLYDASYGSVVVRIGELVANPESTSLLVPVSVRTIDLSIAGFNLKIACFDPAVSINDVHPGSLFDSCGWELFDARPVKMNKDRAGAPPHVWQMVGLARMVADSTVSACHSFDESLDLAYLEITVDPLRTTSDTIPLLFYWQECRDNTVSGESGVTMFVSRNVLASGDRILSDRSELFPNTTGAPRQCVNLAAPTQPQRRVDYVHGAIHLSSDTLMRDSVR
jgi:hypothetical protein